MQKSKFHIGAYELTLNRDAYLVHVRSGESVPDQNGIWDLPDWVFRSKEVIWLLDEDAWPLYHRSLKGELIKKELLEAFLRSEKMKSRRAAGGTL